MKREIKNSFYLYIHMWIFVYDENENLPRNVEKEDPLCIAANVNALPLQNQYET